MCVSQSPRRVCRVCQGDNINTNAVFLPIEKNEIRGLIIRTWSIFSPPFRVLVYHYCSSSISNAELNGTREEAVLQQETFILSESFFSFFTNSFVLITDSCVSVCVSSLSTSSKKISLRKHQITHTTFKSTAWQPEGLQQLSTNHCFKSTWKQKKNH